MSSSQLSENHQDKLFFMLPEVMTIETAEAVAGELKQLSIAEKNTITLDASNVEAISTAGLQLLVSLEKTLEGQGGELIITGQKNNFIHACNDSGLKSLLNHCQKK